MPTTQTLPDWYTPDPDAHPAPEQPAPANQTLPSWYTPEPPEPEAPAEPTDWGAAKNFITGLARVPGAIIGAPAAINHALNWAVSKAGNAVTGGGITADQLDNTDPIARALPTSQGVDKLVFGAMGTTPYEPTSLGGKLGQAAVTGAGAGLLDPLADLSMLKNAGGAGKALLQIFKANAGQAAKTGLASTAAEGTHEVFPDSDVLPVAAALLTHGGAGLGGKLATGGAGVGADAIRQVFAPDVQGIREAGQTLAKVPSAANGEAIAQPTGSDLTAARDAVRGATDDVGQGMEDWQAGGALRSSLQGHVDSLGKARDLATSPLRDARDSSAALISTDPVFNLIDAKLRMAAGPQAEALRGARKDFALPDGTTRNDAESLAATRQAINTRIGSAKASGDNASAAHLLDVRRALDDQINAAVPEAGQYTRAFADASRPLDPSTYGPVGQLLERDQFNSRYTFPDERVPDLFLKSKATRADMQQLVDAFGGDKKPAHDALEQHIVGKVQDAINPDGTLSQAAFDRSVKPYTKPLSMWFPDLAKKFNTAKSAQGALDKMTAQRSIADAIDGGSLRDGDGVITGKSFAAFMRANKDTLAKTQTPGAVMRLQSIQNALTGSHQGELADVLKSEILPAAAGLATGGLEGGVFGTLLHKTVQGAFGAKDAQRQAAFSRAIEQATLDPAYAAKITAGMGKQPGSMSPTRRLVRSVFNTAAEMNAAGGRE